MLAAGKVNKCCSLLSIRCCQSLKKLLRQEHKDKHLLGRVKLQFRVKDYVPSMEGLTEGYSTSQFNAKYGSIYDPRYKAVVAEIEKRVKSLGGYAK